jgi:polyhydroxyalkanoate synthesis regulator protein
MEKIIKYKTRKLWSYTHGDMSLRTIAALIKGGASVQVTDHETGEDITAKTLAQILVNENNVPVSALQELIRS